MAKEATATDMTNEQFVANLYLHLLARAPKTGDVEYWVGVLEDGGTRSDVVERFMSSAEFLNLQKTRSQLPERPTSEQQTLLHLQTHVARQQSFGPEEQQPGAVGEHVPSIDAAKITKLSADTWAAKEAVGQLNPRNPGLLNRFVQAAKKLMQRSLTWYTRSLDGFHEQVARAIEEQGQSLLRLESEIREIQNQESRRLSENERLRDALRETELAVQEQLVPYVDFFRDLSPVVDLGCGRGEFLVVLKENGVTAYGVDSDRAACEMARRKLLNVVDGDILEHLRQLPERSLGGVFSARVIEFLPLHAQMELISLCSKKIRPGGVLVIETTNPESRRGFGRVSHLDPTHRRAVPSELMKSAFESNHFRDVRISVLGPVKASLVTPAAPSSSDFFGTAERSGEMLPGASSCVTTSPAYAAVGWRI